ncbi:hypothetical protein [Ramlibacter humi]|uniref:Transglycosylase SLT domain-containing protein n=1 Tax=Ramlibacter humi TaxID=2530451 RepID=A0A4Z0BJZ5_9BURK|nr:hypothetical protein [Ramlibacter humi]TFY99111.1 hypothetical protein EZ216_16265 [Ramlibacter humi]
MDLPIGRTAAQRICAWIKGTWREPIEAALQGTPFDIDLACAIACKETGVHVFQFLGSLSDDDILARCVFDASGDAAGTSRSAFPRNTAAFRSRYGDAFTEMLIEEANRTRLIRGLDAASWVYKGYGLFQYDLQHVVEDEAFFRGRRWYDFDACLDKLVSELQRKYDDAHGDLRDAVRRYNGSGPKAELYATHVMQYLEFSQAVEA